MKQQAEIFLLMSVFTAVGWEGWRCYVVAAQNQERERREMVKAFSLWRILECLTLVVAVGTQTGPGLARPTDHPARPGVTLHKQVVPSALGTTQQVFAYPPEEVFQAAVSAFHRERLPGSIDWNSQTVDLAFIGGSPVRIRHLTVSFDGLPEDCGSNNLCTETKVVVSGDGTNFNASQSKMGAPDLNALFSKLQEMLNQNRVTIHAIRLDTGPFAAAELHTWAPDNNRHFVVVKVEYKSRPGTLLCAPYTVILLTDSGKEHAPGVPGASPEMSERSYASYDRVSTYDFAVGPTERPKTLDLELASNIRAACEAKYGGNWEWLAAPPRVSLPLASLPAWSDLAVFDQSSAPVRIGQLLVGVTGVARVNKPTSGAGTQRLGVGYYSVLVVVGTKNVSGGQDCTRFSARLLTDHGYRPSQFSEVESSLPLTYGLRPGEISGGTLAFDVWRNSRPVALLLDRSIEFEKFCAERSGRHVDMHGGSVVRIPIQGLPAREAARGADKHR